MKKIFGLFLKVVALILFQNIIKVLTGTNIVKQVKFKGVRWGVRSKILFPETMLAKIFQTNCSFSVK